METKPTLKKWLKLTGLTYEVFAQKLGLKKQGVERIVNNKDKLSLIQALRIWRATGREVCLMSLYPNLGPVIEDIKHIKKEDICENIGGEK